MVAMEKEMGGRRKKHFAKSINSSRQQTPCGRKDTETLEFSVGQQVAVEKDQFFF